IQLANFFNRKVEWMDDGVDVLLSNPAGNQLRVLRSEIEDEDCLHHHGNFSARATNRTRGDILRQSAAKSAMNLLLQISFSLKATDVTKSVRFRSSTIGWSAAKPRGGLLSVLPSIFSFDFLIAFHSDEPLAIVSRIFASAGASGCQMPAAAKHSWGERC